MNRFRSTPLVAALAFSFVALPVAGANATITNATALPVLSGGKQRYAQKRQELVDNSRRGRFSADITLNRAELLVEAHLKTLRSNELAAYRTSGTPLMAQPFLSVKHQIRQTQTYAALQRMPKGGLLHVHSISLGRADWIVDTAAQRPDCYISWGTNSSAPKGRFTFHPAAFIATNAEFAGYVRASDLRDQLGANQFREQILQLITLRNGQLGWNGFLNCLALVANVSGMPAVGRDYYRDAFEWLYDDGVSYVEMRSSVGCPVDPASLWPTEQYMQDLLKIRDKVRQNRPDFDLRIICAANRTVDVTNAFCVLTNALRLQAQFTNFIVGCDFVGEEDMGGPTEEIGELCQSFGEKYPMLHFYLHDGESLWADDMNLFDAMLVRPKRIGHGFNLFRFPALEDHAIRASIALEVCPISNQSLQLTPDLRLHPAAGYLNRGVQCVLASDDPLVFGNDGLTYDFWQAFMSWNLGLGSLKKLARNSLEYSSMSCDEKMAAITQWSKRWDGWIASVVTNDLHLALPANARTAPVTRADICHDVEQFRLKLR
jgi:adenosine deaminase CECR1